MLDETFEIIEGQDRAIREEYGSALKQAQDTIRNLEAANLSLLRQNTMQVSQITVLQSQKTEDNKLHEADMNALQERNKTLEEALSRKGWELYSLKEKADSFEAKVAIYEESLSNLKNTVSAYASPLGVFGLNAVFLNLISATERKLQEQKEKEDKFCCIQ